MAGAQSLNMQSAASTGGLPGESTELMRHRDISGKPCLAFAGIARPHLVNPKLFDHVMAVDNHCSQQIKIHVCYSKTDHCIDMELPSYGRKEAILGMMPSEPTFQFDFKERF
jgi:hypothetical protein